MIFSRKKNSDKENAQQKDPSAETGNAAPREEQPEWRRSFRINNCRFTSRQCIELQRKDDCFLLDGKWISYCELPLVLDEEIDDKMRYCHDTRDGERVLALYEDVPTFDSGDRMYDSVHKAYIKRIGKELIALYIANGYVLSESNLYLGVKPENDDAAQMLRDTSFGE